MPEADPKLKNESKALRRHEPGDSWRNSRPKLNEAVDAVTKLVSSAPLSSQAPGMPIPYTPKIYHAIQTCSGGETSCSGQQLKDDGTLAAVEVLPKAKGYAITSGAKCILAQTALRTKVLLPVVPQKYMYFQQGSDADGAPYDFPSDGEDWFTTHVRHGNYSFTDVHIWSTSGSYKVQLKIEGSLVGDEVNDSTTYPHIFDPPIEYEADDPVTLHVASGSNVDGFEAVFTMVERN